MAQKHGRKPLVYENAAVLRVIREFNDVKRAIFGLHKMCLGAPAHFADQRTGAQGHAKFEMSQSVLKASKEKDSRHLMAASEKAEQAAAASEPRPGAGPDEIALELMKFIAITTGYGRGPTGAGFNAKGARSSEEFADALLELFERCRAVVRKEPK